MNFNAPDGSPSLLSPADNAYIRSGEFKLRFGDWEKAWRLEKAKSARNIPVSNQIFLNGRNITGEIEELRKNRNTKMLRVYAKQIGKTVTGTYFNEDTKENILVSNRNISEICYHTIEANGTWGGIYSIPQIIKDSFFISEEKNTKSALHPYIEKYQYFLSGLKINDDYFTVKSVIAVDRNNNRYYDHKLFAVEKSLLIDTVNKERGSLGVHTSLSKPTAPRKSSSVFNDKRLYDICQCPQAQFLEKNFEPKKEVVGAVRCGKTLCDLENDLAKKRREVSLRGPLEDFLKENSIGNHGQSPKKEIKKDTGLSL